jgi:hypothetical protein
MSDVNMRRLTKINNSRRTSSRISLKPKIWLLLVGLLGLLLAPSIASATTLISQAYLTNSDIPVGSIVSLQNNSSDYVNAASITSSSNILGVVIENGDSQLSVSSGQGNQIQVATSGIQQALVSNINGNINVGDPITTSPISGVGMKATNNTTVVGLAQGSFPNSTSSQQSYTDKSGQKHTVNIGEIPVLVNVSNYYKQPNKTIVPAALQNLADALAGKTVDSLPIIIGMGIFIVTMIIVVSIIYSMIHGSIISVGRNPMSQAAVYRNVIQLSALVVIILAVSFASIYTVLTRF